MYLPACTPRRYTEIGLVDFHSFLTLSVGDEYQTPVTFDLGQQVPLPHEQGGCLGHRFSADDKIIILRNTRLETLPLYQVVDY